LLRCLLSTILPMHRAFCHWWLLCYFSTFYLLGLLQYLFSSFFRIFSLFFLPKTHQQAPTCWGGLYAQPSLCTEHSALDDVLCYPSTFYLLGLLQYLFSFSRLFSLFSLPKTHQQTFTCWGGLYAQPSLCTEHPAVDGVLCYFSTFYLLGLLQYLFSFFHFFPFSNSGKQPTAPSLVVEMSP